MPELVQVNEDVYYLSNHQNYGVIRVGDGECLVIDTGVGDKQAQMILAALAAEKLRPVAILNTHSHADHYGGNSYIVKQTGCKVYAPPVEAAIMTNPSLEPFYIYGANPPQELTQRILMGTKSPVDELLETPEVTIGAKQVKVVPLDGHSPNQMGVIIDDVFFCGDSVFSQQAWERFVLVYAVDIGRMMKSIERLGTVGAKSFVPSHATPTGDISELATFNATRIQALTDDIAHILTVPAEATTVLQEICMRYGLAIRSLQQYYLSLNTVKAYLSYLYEQTVITYELDSSRLLWRTLE
ncbi:MAG TPA: MBL fold metallo-hydrolase [Candidatus Aquicultor sp.]|jgi:glyoxylase-like metal-dependent hydrolase (beta-lactamase superfamily II)